MKGFDCLDSEQDVWGHHFLEASAGTGKTFTIEHIVTRLLMDPQAIDIDQILIVTFTRAATRELKQRIQKRLRECLKALENHEAIYPYLDLNPEDRQFAILRLELALSCFDKAQIYTIHAFCHRMLLEEGFEAGISLELSDPEDRNFQGFIEHQAKDFLRTGLKSDVFCSSQIEKVLQACGGNSHKLAVKIAQLANEDSCKVWPISQTLSQLNANLQHFPNVQEEELEVLARQFKGVCTRSGDFLPSIEKQIRLLKDVLDKKEIDHQQLDAFIGSNPCLILQLRKENLKKTVKEKLPALHTLIEKHLYPHFEQATDAKSILQSMASLYQERLTIAKSAHEMTFPDDILLQLDKAMDHQAFAEKIRDKYKAAIIDEFQDTDPVQWSIFQKLFLASQCPIPAFYLVGDPKQSIYAFRKADLYTYLRASEKVGKENRRVLSVNYRSSPELIDGLNTLFSHEKAGKWLQLPSTSETIDYQPVQAHKETDSLDDDKKAVHILQIDDFKARSVPSKDLENQVIFPYIATQIKALGLDFSSFAILIKDRFQAVRLQKFFKRLGIPSISQSGTSVCASKAYLLLDALIQAALKPGALTAIKRFLSAPIVAWSYTDLLRDRFDEKITDVSSKLHALKTTWEKQGFAAFINAAMMCQFGHDQNLHQMLAIEKENYVDFIHLVELLLEEDGKRCHTPHDLYQIFKRFKEINPDHHAQFRQRKTHQESAVTIMTTHMSKGLEFDVVFALGIGCRHHESEDLEREAEKLRLFYVALTRAKRRVYIPVIRTPEKPPESGCASPAEKFFARWGDLHVLSSSDISVETLKGPIQSPGFTRETKSDPVFPKAHGLHFEKRLISSYSGLVSTSVDFDAPHQSKEYNEHNLYTLPAGAQTGSVLHYLLEKVIESGFYRDQKSDRIEKFVLERLINTDLKPWAKVIAQLIHQIMFLPFDGFCLSEVMQDTIAQEMEFLLPMQPDLMIKGFADLIFQYRDKTYIIDWKSNWLGENAEAYTHSNLEKAMQHHDYFLQARIYGAAVIKWMQKFENRPPSDFYGGAYYVFLRGIENEESRGIYHYRNL